MTSRPAAAPATMPPRRLVVLGAGAVGAGIGGLLWATGTDVLLIARGAHGRALAETGLDLRLPAGPRRLRVPVGSLADVRDGDVVMLATMAHDTAAAVAALPVSVPIVTVQNGLAPFDALHGRPVLAAMLYVPAERRAPGVVALAGSPDPGAIFVGRWPTDHPSGAVGLAAVETWLTDALRRAGFRAEGFADIAPWIRAKAITTLGGIFVALCDDPPTDWIDAAVAEARACFDADGLDVVPDAVFDARIGPMTVVDVDGLPRRGGSTRHALARGDRLETEALHGDFVRRGARLGVPTPVNAALVALAALAYAEGWRPGALSAAALREAIEAALV